MQISNIFNRFLIVLISLLPACATQRPQADLGAPGNHSGRVNTIRADPRLDHLFAWIPIDRAETASVAEALVHIELGRAKDAVAKTLCGGGWPISGAPVDSSGPYPSTAPVALGGYPAWYYHVSHQPGFTGCDAVPTAQLYRELDSRLPPWITVSAAASQVSVTSGTEIAATSAGH